MSGLKLHERQLCDIQGRFFNLAACKGYASAAFIDSFMASEAAAALDRPYDRLQWAGEEYLLEQVEEELSGTAALASGEVWPSEALFWIGYLYRFWHFLTAEPSAVISQAADAATMFACWPGYHTLDPEMAVERLKEAVAER